MVADAGSEYDLRTLVYRREPGEGVVSHVISRRSLAKGAVATAAGGALAVGAKRSKVFAVPNIIRQTGSNVEISFWYGLTGDVGDRIQDVIDDFNAQDTGITVRGLQNTSYEDTAQNLTLALQDGSYPDAVLLPEQLWFRFYLSNSFIPLDDLISATNFDLDDLVPALREEGFRNGSYYWLPVARSTALMYYNKTLYEAAGLPGPAETYSQLREYAQALTDESNYVYGMGFAAAAWYFQGSVWAFNGAYSTSDFEITFNQGGAVEAGHFYQQGIQEGWADVPQDPVADFGNGFIATAFFSTGSLKTVTDMAEDAGYEVGTAFKPLEAEGARFSACTGGSGIGILSGIPAERQEAAFRFYAFWASPEKTAWWSQNTGYMPVRLSAIESPEMQAFFEENPNFKVAIDQLAERAAPSDPARRFVNAGQDVINHALEEIMIANVPVQEAFDAAAVALAEEAAPVIELIKAKEGDGALGS